MKQLSLGSSKSSAVDFHLKNVTVVLKWGPNQLCPIFGWQHMDGSFSVKPLKQKQIVSTFLPSAHSKYTHLNYLLAKFGREFQFFNQLCFLTGGPSQLLAAGDLWDWEQK